MRHVLSGFILFALLAGCGGSPGSAPDAGDPFWEWVGGDRVGCTTTANCVSQRQTEIIISDFAFAGDALLVTADNLGVFRYDPSTNTWSEPLSGFLVGRARQLETHGANVWLKADTSAAVVQFDGNGTRGAAWEDPLVDTHFDSVLRMAPSGHPLLVGPLKSNPNSMVLVDIDMATGATQQTPLPAFRNFPGARYALDDTGRVFYPSPPATTTGVTMSVLDRTGGAPVTVTWAAPPPDAEGNKFAPFLDNLLWGPVPGGGVLGFRQLQRGMMLVRITADGKTTDVIDASALSTVSRLRVKDGYVYASGVGLWRTRQRVIP